MINWRMVWSATAVAVVLMVPAQTVLSQRTRAWEVGLGGDVGPLSWVLPMADDGSQLRSVQGNYRMETPLADYRGSLLLLEERNGQTRYVYQGTSSTATSVLERDRLVALALFVDRHLPFPDQVTLITSLGLGVVPWVEGRRINPNQSGAALLTRTGNGSFMSVGLGVRSENWLIDAQFLLVRYNRTILGSNVLLPITVARRF